jgi:hypothetical protein
MEEVRYAYRALVERDHLNILGVYGMTSLKYTLKKCDGSV